LYTHYTPIQSRQLAPGDGAGFPIAYSNSIPSGPLVLDVGASYIYTPIQSRQLVGNDAGFPTAYLNLNGSSTSTQYGSSVDIGATGTGFPTAYLNLEEPVSIQSNLLVDVSASYSSWKPVQSGPLLNDVDYDFAQLG
jgi:hypothetical protein